MSYETLESALKSQNLDKVWTGGDIKKGKTASCTVQTGVRGLAHGEGIPVYKFISVHRHSDGS